MPREVSKRWLWTSQNAFLKSKDPSTGADWADRHGHAFGKGFSKSGVVEPYLSYKKLQRTGKLLRSLKAKSKFNSATGSAAIELSSGVPYASDHELGGGSGGGTLVKGRYVTGGASGVVLGGRVVARPFMKPSQEVLESPYRLLVSKMSSFGWTKFK